MNHDSAPDVLAASAYLDDDVDVAERARIEASAELMALVESLRSARTALHAPIDIDARRREAAIAAALAAALPTTDADHAADTTAPDTTAPGTAAPDAGDGSRFPTAPAERLAPVVPLRRPMRWIAGAAAAGLVVVAGVSVLTRGSDDSSDSAGEGAAITASEPASDGADETFSIQVDDAPSTTAAAGDAGGSADRAGTPEAAESTTGPIDGPAVVAGGGAAADATAAIPPSPKIVATPDDLATFAREAGEADDAREPPCGLEGQVLGDVAYETQTAAVPAIVMIEEASGDTVAIDPATCTELGRAPAA